MARRSGAAPVTRGFGDPVAQAGARRFDMKLGAASRNRTGVPWLAPRNPAAERWPHPYMKTNTAASPVRNSHPQEIFTADLSVFQAHLPCWHDSLYHVMRSLWFVIGVPGARE